MDQFIVRSNWSPVYWGVNQFHHGKNVQIHSKSNETQTQSELRCILV
jgi:hypothetical protein